MGIGSPHGPLRPGTLSGTVWPDARTTGWVLAFGSGFEDKQPPAAAARIIAPTDRFMAVPQIPQIQPSFVQRRNGQNGKTRRRDRDANAELRTGAHGFFAFFPPSALAICRPRPWLNFR